MILFYLHWVAGRLPEDGCLLPWGNPPSWYVFLLELERQHMAASATQGGAAPAATEGTD